MFDILLSLWLVATCLVKAQSLWIEEQYNASLRMLLDNIYENGTVIASPSREEPDYYVPLFLDFLTFSIMYYLVLGANESGFGMRRW
jgi:hypothetical protein